jgi:putative PIN family toxin of toxin-antitoxin system
VIRKEILGGISNALSVEIRNVLGRRKFDVSKEYVTAALDSLQAVFERVVPEETVNGIVGDADDNAVLECALAFEADFIITGDRHLLDVRRFRGIEIMTPSEFLDKHFL